MLKPAINLTRASFRTALDQIHANLPALETTPDFMAAQPAEPLTPLADLTTTGAVPTAPTLTIRQQVAQMQAGSLTATQLLEQAYAAIAARQNELNAFVTVTPPAELFAAAAQLDAEAQSGQLRGALHGIPISVKDVIAVAGLPNTASSRVLADNIAQSTAESVARLQAAGALIIGKTQTCEFALGVVTRQSRNPWDATRDPGGSSGGSAISVTTGMSIASLGTDTRASIRVPAALCGIVGYKPTYGLVPTTGVTTLSWSLDHVAHHTRNVADAATMLAVLAAQPGYAQLGTSVQGWRVGVVESALVASDPVVQQAFANTVSALTALGVQVNSLPAPSAAELDEAVYLGLVISRCEAAAYHATLKADPDLYSPEIWEQLDEANQIRAVDYIQAQRLRHNYRQRLLGYFANLDALILPTTRTLAPKHENAADYFLSLSQNCIAWSFVGFPAMSLPCGWSGSPPLPVGAQLVGKPQQDQRLLTLAAALESVLGVALP